MYERTTERLRELFGLVPLPSWHSDLPEAVKELCREHSVQPSHFEHELLYDPAILRQLAGRLSIGETYFLRDAFHFERIAEYLVRIFSAEHLPPLVWSAGCASGEEPYSLAIVLERFSPVLAEQVRIIASDISREALDKARRGIYRNWSFRGAPPWLLHEHFTELPQQQWELQKTIRGRVEFFEESLQERLNQFREDSVDIILFRNVAIYMEPASLQRIHEEFFRILRPNGLLVQCAGDGRPQAHLFEPWIEGEYGPFKKASQVNKPAQEALPEAGPACTPEREKAAEAIIKRKPQPKRSATGNFNMPDKNSLIALNSNTVPLDEEALRHALALGDQGRIAEAIDQISSLLEKHPGKVSLLLARGQLLLAAGLHQQALSDLRQVVFEKPEHLTARYWLSVSLRMLGLHDQASLQLQHLSRALSEFTPAHLLNDGITTAAELADAVSTDLRILR